MSLPRQWDPEECRLLPVRALFTADTARYRTRSVFLEAFCMQPANGIYFRCMTRTIRISGDTYSAHDRLELELRWAAMQQGMQKRVLGLTRDAFKHHVFRKSYTSLVTCRADHEAY
jgi:hypothetical protein